jgi:hypothetical protein
MKKIVTVFALACMANIAHGELITNDLESKLPSDTKDLYIDLVQRAVGNFIYAEEDTSCDPKARERGEAWPRVGHTMLGRDRLRNIHFCLKKIIQDKIPGDCIETGVWRGGATILMRAILKAYGDTQRKVWVADSFEGFPISDPEKYPADAAGVRYADFKELIASLDQVQQNFKKYGLLDKQVYFLKGFFSDTLPHAPIGPIALLRLDCDTYQATMESLDSLYPKLSPGGYIIIDDFGSNPSGCAKAVLEYRKLHNINEPICTIDSDGVYWRKAKEKAPEVKVVADLPPETFDAQQDQDAQNAFDWSKGRWEK